MYPDCQKQTRNMPGLVAIYLFLHECRNQVFSKQITAAYQPDVQHACQQERLGTSLFELFDAGICTKSGHGHRQHESINIFDCSVQWNIFYTVYAQNVLQK